MTDPDDELVEIYHAHSEATAQALCDEVLGANGIEAYVRVRSSRAFPSGTADGAYYVAVAATRAGEARTLVTEATGAGVLGDDGELLPAEGEG